MRRSLLTIAAGLSLGCAADRVAKPDDAAVVPLAASAAQVDAAGGVMTDVRSRVISGSERLTANAELVEAIDAVNHAIERADARALDRALTKANRVVARLGEANIGDAAELDAIALALADARRLIEAPPNS